mmetsp:Transcript_65480/g.153200  ORF Transcript_65480/g.153200 Transcript_65480/m.153200 type:complete len:219 (-) Transcript_65480:379-1035(-)
MFGCDDAVHHRCYRASRRWRVPNILWKSPIAGRRRGRIPSTLWPTFGCFGCHRDIAAAQGFVHLISVNIRVFCERLELHLPGFQQARYDITDAPGVFHRRIWVLKRGILTYVVRHPIITWTCVATEAVIFQLHALPIQCHSNRMEVYDHEATAWSQDIRNTHGPGLQITQPVYGAVAGVDHVNAVVVHRVVQVFDDIAASETHLCHCVEALVFQHLRT